MPLLPDYLKVADLTVLKALTAVTDRRDGELKIVDSVNDSLPEYNLTDVIYRYNAASAADGLEPAIVVPDDSNGRWIMTGNPLAIAEAVPTAAPPLANLRYIALLDTPTRTVEWKSPPYLSASPVTDDWQGNTNPSDINGVPTFNADFVGQVVRDTNTGWIYRAIDQTGSWVIYQMAFVYGSDLTVSETLTLTYARQYKQVTADLTVTLPAGLPTNIETRLIVPDTITLTLTPDTGTTLNGGTSNATATNTTVVLHNNGDSWLIYS